MGRTKKNTPELVINYDGDHNGYSRKNYVNNSHKPSNQCNQKSKKDNLINRLQKKLHDKNKDNGEN